MTRTPLARSRATSAFSIAVPVASPPECRMRGIRVRRLESLDERAFGVAVERDAEVDEFADARGSLFGEHAHGGRGR